MQAGAGGVEWNGHGALVRNIYELPARTAKSALVKVGARKMAAVEYYRKESEAYPWRKRSVAPSSTHLGNIRKPCLNTKGAQTRCLVKFFANLMHKHKERLGDRGQSLAVAGTSSIEGSNKMISDAISTMWCSFVLQGSTWFTKHHGMIHMVLMVSFIGNPRHISTYQDEHENGVCARTGLRCHGLTFAKSVFEREELLNNERRVLPLLNGARAPGGLSDGIKDLKLC